ncbi:Arc family DNA-binding protein [Kineothrix sedimenti]|uniref:Arc family DNA-binding protein n=1 Tax=Kineothrix sedimenti TaxID=3123317 RepID=A0ABZ3F3U0_9FIRM
MEAAILKGEKAIKEKEKAKKQVLLRLSPGLWNELAAWAEDDFRSINGQIEYLLADCVRKRKNKEK